MFFGEFLKSFVPLFKILCVFILDFFLISDLQLAESAKAFLSECVIDEGFLSFELRLRNYKLLLNFGSFCSNFIDFCGKLFFLLVSDILEEAFEFVGTLSDVSNFLS